MDVPARDDVEAEALEDVLLLLLVDLDADDPRSRGSVRKLTTGGSGRSPLTSVSPGPARAGEVDQELASRVGPRAAPGTDRRPSPSGSSPRCGGRWRSELRRIVPGSKLAASSRTAVVVSVTSVSSPPMIPANAIAASPSAITRSAGSSLRRLPSRLANSSPGRARRTTIRPPRSVSKSKAWSGFPSASMT